MLEIAGKFATGSDVESVLCVEEVVKEYLLASVLLRLLDCRVVQGSSSNLVVFIKLCIERIKLTDNCWSDRALSVESWLTGGGSLVRGHNVRVIIIAVLDTIDQRGV